MSSVDSLYPPFLLLLSYYLYISHIHSRSQTVKTHDCFLNLARKLATNLEILISVSDKNLLFWQLESLLLQLLRLIILGVILCQWCHNFKKEELAFWESWKIGLVLKIQSASPRCYICFIFCGDDVGQIWFKMNLVILTNPSLHVVSLWSSLSSQWTLK